MTTASPDPDDALTVTQVARLLKVSPKFVRALIGRGRLRAKVIGFGTVRPRKRVSRAELARYLAADEAAAGAPAAQAPRRRGKLPPVPQYV